MLFLDLKAGMLSAVNQQVFIGPLIPLRRLLVSAENSGTIKQIAFTHKELIGWLEEMRHKTISK